jgi:hypothetical protein
MMLSGKVCQHTFKPIIQQPGTYTSSPRSIAIGNFNDDQILDIVVANNAIDNVAVLLGYGNGTFANRQIYSTGFGSSPFSVAVGDFNNDNRSDIVVANSGTHNVGLLLGYGNGTFADQILFSTGSSCPLSIAAGDLNTDTCLDIVVTNWGTNDIAVLLGNGNGSFRLSMTYWTGYDSVPYFVIIADFNRDSFLDIAVANAGTSNVGVFLGYGNGTFASLKTYSTGPGSNPYAIAVGDFNHDTQLDLAVANTGTNEIAVMFGYGNGSFKSRLSVSFNPSSSPQNLVVGDFNNDKKLDIAIANTNMDNIGILLGYGNGEFAIQIEYSTGSTSQPISIAVGDFNLDNQLDIATANNGLNTVGILIASITSPGGNEIISIVNGSYPTSIAGGDFNNDTQFDIAVANYNTSNVDILLGDGYGTFTLFTTYSTGIGSKPQFIVTEDFNHDGLLDIIVANHGTDNVGVVLGYGNGTFTNLMTYSTGLGSDPFSIAIGDFNNDGHLDISVANNGTNNIGVLLGYGNGTFGIQTTYSMGDQSEPLSIAVGDFNNDNRLDIAATLAEANSLNVLLGYGDGTFQMPLTYPTEYGSTPRALALADFNNDNKLDVAVVSWATFYVVVSLGNGNGGLAIPTKYSTGFYSYPIDVKVVDVNNDSVLDIVVANYGTDSVGVFFGYGDGTFANQTALSIGSSHPISIVVGDFNHDGWIDLAVANGISNNIVVLLGNYDVNYQNTESYITGSGSHPYFIAVHDFNNDNKLDLAVANMLGNNIGVLQGFGNGSFKAEVTYSTGADSAPLSIAVADFNNDNQPDIVFANRNSFSIGLRLGYGNGTFGSMTTYSTGLQVSPISIAVDDLNNDARLDIVVAQYTANSIGIFFGYNYTNFPNIQLYSTGYLSRPLSVAIGDFNNDNHPDIAVTNIVASNIGILLGYGNGTFAAQMTYSTGSGTAPYSIGLGDFNNDTRLDIVVANQDSNSVGILMGYGDGTFANSITFFTGNDSQPHCLTVNDFNNDGRLDIAIANTDTYNVGVFLGNGDGTFASQKIFLTGPDAPPFGIVTGDFNKDGFIDIGVTILNNSTVGILLGYGNGTFREVTKYAMGTGTNSLYSIALGDFNDDTRIDIVAADYNASQIGIFLGHGDGTFYIASTYSTGDNSFPRSVAVGDFNNDNLLDICVVDSGIQKVGIFYGYSDGDFSTVVNYAIGDDLLAFILAVGDLNHDNKLDIVLANYYMDSVGVLLASGSEAFSSSTSFSMGINSVPCGIAIGDLNNDNRKDIAVVNTGTNNIGILLGNGNRTFQNMIIYITGSGSNPIAIAVGNFNHDYCLDIAIANFGANNVGIFLGQCDGTFRRQISYSTGDGSSPISIVLSDFNDDNLTDISVANAGINSVGVFLGYGNGTFRDQMSYTIGYGSHPVCIAVGDFNGDGSIDMAVANNNADNLEIFLNSC